MNADHEKFGHNPMYDEVNLNPIQPVIGRPCPECIKGTVTLRSESENQVMMGCSVCKTIWIRDINNENN